LYDALDFSNDRNDGGGETRESLSRFASSSAAVGVVEVPRRSRFAPDVLPKFGRIGITSIGSDEGDPLLRGTAEVKFGNETRTLI
jgi:hypothetical protein